MVSQPFSTSTGLRDAFGGKPILSPAALAARIGGEEVLHAMCSAGSQTAAARWLAENGPRELELLFRAIVYHPAAPILITDSDGNSRDASVGVGKLLGLPRGKVIGRRVDDFAPPGFKPRISQLWRALGEQEGTLRLVTSRPRVRVRLQAVPTDLPNTGIAADNARRKGANCWARWT